MGIILWATLILTANTNAVSSNILSTNEVQVPTTVEPAKTAEELTSDELDKIFDDSEKAVVEINAMLDILSATKEPEPELLARYQARLNGVTSAYEKFIKKNPNNVLALMCYGDFLNDLGSEEEAAALWTKASELDPNNADAWNSLANVEGHHGDIRIAFDYYKKAIELNPKEPRYYQNFATSVFLFRADAKEYFNEDESQVFDRAISLYKQAVELDPKNLELLQDFATSYDGIKPYRFKDAFDIWESVVKLAEELKNQSAIDDAHIHQARFEMLAKNYTKARELLAKVKDSPEQDPRIANIKARLLRAIAKEEKAE